MQLVGLIVARAALAWALILACAFSAFADPDLVPLGFTAPGSVVSGRSLRMVLAVTNRGTGNLEGGWADTVWLSTDAVWDPQDQQIFQQYQSRTVPAGGTYQWTNDVAMPQVPDGTYYLIAKVDDPNSDWGKSIFEGNEANNVSVPFAQKIVGVATAPARTLAGQAGPVTDLAFSSDAISLGRVFKCWT